MNKASSVSENVTLEMNVTKCLEVVPLPSICTGTQDEQHKEMEDSPARAKCETGIINVQDECGELQAEEVSEMKKASPVSENATLEMNVSKSLEVVSLPSICTGTQDEHYKEMEYFLARENCDNLASTKQV